MTDQNSIQQRAWAVEEQMKRRFGNEDTDTAIQALATRGVDQDQIQRALARTDADTELMKMARDAMNTLADTDQEWANRVGDLRSKEREQHARNKGRIR